MLPEIIAPPKITAVVTAGKSSLKLAAKKTSNSAAEAENNATKVNVLKPAVCLFLLLSKPNNAPIKNAITNLIMIVQMLNSPNQPSVSLFNGSIAEISGIK